jgi:hypothetical protein
LGKRHEFLLSGGEWSRGRFLRECWHLFARHERGEGLEVGVGRVGSLRAVLDVEEGVGRVIEAWRKAWSVREG